MLDETKEKTIMSAFFFVLFLRKITLYWLLLVNT